MPPASLLRKVMAYELSEADKHRKMTKSKKTKTSSSARIIVNKATLKRARDAMSSRAQPKAKKIAKKAQPKATKNAAGTAKSSRAAASSKSATKASKSTQARQGVWIEPAKNGMSKCRCCREKISKQHTRLVIVKGSTTKYFHPQCFPQEQRKKLPKHIYKQLSPLTDTNDPILQQRSALVDVLKLKYSHYLDEKKIYTLVRYLPTTETAVIAITGKLSEDFDPGKSVTRAMWEDIEYFLDSKRRSAAVERSRRHSNRSPEVIVIDDSDDEKAGSSALGNPGKAVKPPPQNQVEDDGEVLCEETLTCAEVIQKKFDQAAANGEVVDID
mmetsp:Transcript_6448/g.15660  ORF Transcript_6448/g.15660 Transcript_6448/m.15660 type:complete len:328 (+) Transcript_6448:179-1162(+)